MSYEFPNDTEATFFERTPQFEGLGIPTEDIKHLSTAITDMWVDGPGGWCYEWSQVADRYAKAGKPWLASLAYGDARYPCLADQPKAIAMQHQIEQYTLASKDFPVTFDRRIVTSRMKGEVVEVPVHILAEPDATEDTPVLLVSGGVDTWKMDLHHMWVSYILGAHVRVVAFDHPGTGELTHIPLTRESTEIVDGLISYARTLTTGKVGHLGVSFGGYFAAHTALTSAADAAVVIGGPVTTNAFGEQHLKELMYGMEGIVGNAFGFTSIPTDEDFLAHAQSIAMDELVAKGTNCPTLAINGDNDVHVPAADLELWRGRPNTDVVLIPGGTHCAMNKFDQLLPAVTSWLTTALY